VLEASEREDRLVDAVPIAARDRGEEALEEIAVAVQSRLGRVELRRELLGERARRGRADLGERLGERGSGL
jgi:hypothetical protein